MNRILLRFRWLYLLSRKEHEDPWEEFFLFMGRFYFLRWISFCVTCTWIRAFPVLNFSCANQILRFIFLLKACFRGSIRVYPSWNRFLSFSFLLMKSFCSCSALHFLSSCSKLNFSSFALLALFSTSSRAFFSSAITRYTSCNLLKLLNSALNQFLFLSNLNWN